MTLKQSVILSLMISAGVTAAAQDAETYYGLTFIDAPLTVGSPANVVALGDDGGRIANRIEITDGTPFYSPYTFSALSASYTRTFSSTYWQPLYVPYDMRYDDWCDVAQVAALTEVFQYDDDSDGTIDRTVLAFETVNAGAIAANAPYIIRPYNTGTVVIESEDCTVKATPASGGRVGCSAANYVFMLIGVYEDIAVSGYLGDYTLSANVFGLSEGTVVGPGGIYLNVTPNDDGYDHGLAEALPQTVSLMIDDELVGITDITVDPAAAPAVYDLYGRKVDGTPHGVHITVKGAKAAKSIINHRK